MKITTSATATTMTSTDHMPRSGTLVMKTTISKDEHEDDAQPLVRRHAEVRRFPLLAFLERDADMAWSAACGA